MAQLTACLLSALYLVAEINLVIVLMLLSAISDVTGLLEPL